MLLAPHPLLLPGITLLQNDVEVERAPDKITIAYVGPFQRFGEGTLPCPCRATLPTPSNSVSSWTVEYVGLNNAMFPTQSFQNLS